jgi:hypothetical protein
MAYTSIDDPSAYFQAALYTGNSSNNHDIVNTGNSDLQPDLIWHQGRSIAVGGYLNDSTRGTNKYIYSFLTNAEGNVTYYITNYNTDGFEVGTGDNAFNKTSQNYVAWQWKANGGTTSSNTDGGTTSTVQANTDAGFSIVTWTGTGSATTLGHGLGVAPSMILVKNRTTAVDWAIYHTGLTDAGYVIALNNDDGQVDSGTNRWNHTDPTSSVFSVGSGQQTNQNTNNMVAYCFAEKQGYSKIGKYIGNGNADGAFVYTGFKPAFILFKQISANGNGWFLIDNKRDPDNGSQEKYLRADESGAEGTASKILDMYSNGFKLRNADSAINGAGHTYIYMAFAENPFVTSTGIPTTAR